MNFGYIQTKKTYKIFGVPGGKGGSGGDGGKGGKGADSGEITILQLGQPSEIAEITSVGAEGEIGKAGDGGEGGKDGDDIIAIYTFAFMRPCLWNCLRTEWELKETIDNGRRPSAYKGEDGGNDYGLKEPVPPNGIKRPSNVVNEYKRFLRENLNNRIEKYSLLQFLDQLNKRNDVRNLYDTLALIQDFQGLEEQVYKLSDQIDFSPFYSSMMERIKEFAKFLKDGPDHDENKKVLNYLYTATLGRFYDLKKSNESNLIIDIRGYLNLMKENIKTLKDLQISNNKVEVISKYKENYKKGIDKKIEEAKYFVRKQINPEIDSINSKIDDQINSLIEETIAMQKEAEKNQEKLAEKKKELQDAMAVKGLFNFFHIIGGVVGLLGPIGAIAGAVIETTSNIAESLAFNKQKQDLYLPADVVLAVATIRDQIKAMRNKKLIYLNQILDEIKEQIKEYPEKLSDMTAKIDDIKDRLKKVSEKKIEFKQVKDLENEIQQELKRKGDDLKTTSDNKENLKALKVIEKITQIVQFGSLLHEVFGTIKEDKEKIDVVADAMEKIEDKIDKLREYEENIYDTIVPMLQEMEDRMKEISDKLGTKSQVELDVTKWKVQSTLKDMRLQMRRLTEGFKVKDDLSRSIEKLDEVMTTLFNLYDRIQNYQDQQKLSNYIADIDSVAASSINIKNQQLVNAVKHLEYLIRANIVLKQYRSAIEAFKQWVFPFADHYVEKSMLPSQLELDTNIQNLVENAIREIETIKQKLDLYDASIKNGDQYLECEEFNNRYISSQPFFKWKNEEFRSSIASLLSGKEVVLKADVKKSAPYKDAVKFSEINFDFKLKNDTTQSLLYETLKAFDVRATHLGNSYYRHEGEIFLITSESVTIAYSYEKNDDGTPIRANEVYNKLRSGDLLLSPYTLWEVKLINRPNKLEYSFQNLEYYKNEVDVELSGIGCYVDTNTSIPDSFTNLKVYDNTSLSTFEYKALGLNRFRRSRNRLRRSVHMIVGSDYMTNGAPKSMQSPINYLNDFLQTYFITNVITSTNQIFNRAQVFVKSDDDYLELSYKSTEIRNSGPNAGSNSAIADSRNVATTSTEDVSNKEKIGSNSDTVFNFDYDGNKSCAKSFLLSDQNGRSNNHSIQSPDLNCSLLLADLVTRTITGNRYESRIDECLLSPPEVVSGKISDGLVRNEKDIKQILQRYLSEKDKIKISLFAKIKGYAKSMFQYFGLAGNDDTEKYAQDIRNLFL